MDDKDIEKLDLYALFDIPPNAEKADIKKAYRKKALTCHPDKNPDNPDAARLFHQLSKAQDFLLNDTARGIYDRKLKAKHAAQVRNRELDDERKRFKEKLEKQELSAEQERKDDLLQRKIRILREQAKREAEAEEEKSKQDRAERLQEHFLSFCRIRLSWKANKTDPKNGGYNEDLLDKLFSPYGEITAIVVSGKKGRALIEFSNPESANRAVLMVTGLPSNPLKMKILGAADAEDRKQKIQSMMYNSVPKSACSQNSATTEEDQE